jgi:hypothetical protein
MGRAPPPNIFVIKPLITFLLLLTPATLPFLAHSLGYRERGSSSNLMARSAKVLVVALLVLAVAAEAQNIKTMDDATADLPAL